MWSNREKKNDLLFNIKNDYFKVQSVFPLSNEILMLEGPALPLLSLRTLKPCIVTKILLKDTDTVSDYLNVKNPLPKPFASIKLPPQMKYIFKYCKDE